MWALCGGSQTAWGLAQTGTKGGGAKAAPPLPPSRAKRRGVWEPPREPTTSKKHPCF